MSKDYPEEIKSAAAQYGYKSANLQFLAKLAEEFSAARPDARFSIPDINPISNTDILAHLDANAAGWRDQWAAFQAEQGDKRDLTPKSKEILTALQETITKAFEEHPFAVAGLGADELFMVRSTSNEDRVDIANPGGNESVPSAGRDAGKSVGKVIASYFSDKSLSQRLKSREDITSALPLTACLVQKMIGEGLSSDIPPVSGVVYTDGGHIRIQSAPGHGELVVNSKGNFDSYYIDPANNVFAEVREKRFRMVPSHDGEAGKMSLQDRSNPFEIATAPSLTKGVAERMADIARFAESKYGMRMDIEFVYDPSKDEIHLVQARPIPEGHRRSLAPSALSPEFIATEKPESIKTSVITPDIMSATIIEDQSALLICDTIEEALNIYLGSKDGRIKAVIIAREAPDTSHEAGMFTSMAIPVMQAPSLHAARDFAGKLVESRMVIDPQHSSIYRIGRDKEPAIVNGMFKSTLSPNVTALGAKYDPTEVKAILKSYTGTAKYKDLAELTADLDELLTSSFGSDQAENKQKIAHMMVRATVAAKDGKIKKQLYQEIMQTGTALYKTLDNIEKASAHDPEIFRHYLNLHQKFSGLFTSRGKKDVLVDSLVTNMAATKKTANVLSGISAERLESMTPVQTELFTEMMKLRSHIITEEGKKNWEYFCYDAAVKHPDILRGLVGNITKLHLQDFWLNTEFMQAYATDKDHTLENLDVKFNAGREQRSKLMESAKIIDSLEQQISMWSDPANFAKLNTNLKKSLEALDALLTIDSTDPMNAQLAFMQLNKLVDTIDLSIKSLQTSSLYEDKIAQVQNFKTVLGSFMTLLEKQSIADNPNGVMVSSRLKRIKAKLTAAPDNIPAHLLPSAGFSVAQASIYQESRLEFRRAEENLKSLADFHTLIHQGLISSIERRSYEHNMLLTRILPEPLKETMKLLEAEIFGVPNNIALPGYPFLSLGYHPEQIHAQIINIDFSHPNIKIYYNTPLREHSLQFSLGYDTQTKKTILHYQFVGEGVQDDEVDERMRWRNLEHIAKLLLGDYTTSTILSSGADPKTYNLKLELPTDHVQAEKIINCMHFLTKLTFDNSCITELAEKSISKDRMDFFEAVNKFDKETADRLVTKVDLKDQESAVYFYIAHNKTELVQDVLASDLMPQLNLDDMRSRLSRRELRYKESPMIRQRLTAIEIKIFTKIETALKNGEKISEHDLKIAAKFPARFEAFNQFRARTAPVIALAPVKVAASAHVPVAEAGVAEASHDYKPAPVSAPAPDIDRSELVHAGSIRCELSKKIDRINQLINNMSEPNRTAQYAEECKIECAAAFKEAVKLYRHGNASQADAQSIKALEKLVGPENKDLLKSDKPHTILKIIQNFFKKNIKKFSKGVWKPWSKTNKMFDTALENAGYNKPKRSVVVLDDQDRHSRAALPTSHKKPARKPGLTRLGN